MVRGSFDPRDRLADAEAERKRQASVVRGSFDPRDEKTIASELRPYELQWFGDRLIPATADAAWRNTSGGARFSGSGIV